MDSSKRSSSIPEAPWKGLPSLSSLKPGASPTMNRAAFSGPSPKMTCVLEWQSPHFVQPMASFWASTNSKPLKLLTLGQHEAQYKVDREGKHRTRAGDNDGEHHRNDPYHVRIPPVGVGNTTADAPDPTVPSRPLDVQDPASSLLSPRFYTTAVRRFSVGGGISCGSCWGWGVL